MSHTRLISVFTLSLVVILGSSPAAFSGVLDRLFRRKPADGTASVQAEAPATVSPLRKFGFVSHSLDGGQEEISGPGTCDSCQDCGPDDDCQECRWRCGHCKTFKCLWNRHIRRKHPIRSCYPVHPPYWTPHYGYYRTCWRRMGEGNYVCPTCTEAFPPDSADWEATPDFGQPPPPSIPGAGPPVSRHVDTPSPEQQAYNFDAPQVNQIQGFDTRSLQGQGRMFEASLREQIHDAGTQWP